MFTHESESVHMACNFNCHIENAGLLMVTGSNLHCKSTCILERVQDIRG